MDSVDVEVHLPKWVGTPDVSRTAKELDAWELVSLTAKKLSLDPQEVAQNGRCNFVKELHLSVDFSLEYFVAKDFEDNKAKAAGNKGLTNFYAWLQLELKKHAAEHYAQFSKVILA